MEGTFTTTAPKAPHATRLFRQLSHVLDYGPQPDTKIRATAPHGRTATASVLKNAHLMYMILSQVDPASLMHCSRVCTLFRDTIHTSDKLKKALFLIPDTRLWALSSHGHALHPMKYPTECQHCHPEDIDDTVNRMGEVDFHRAHLAHPLLLGQDRPVTKCVYSSWHTKTGLASWLLAYEDMSSSSDLPLLDMFICQPPVQDIVLHIYTDIKLDRQTMICNDTGVTFKDVVDAMDSTVQEWDEDDGEGLNWMDPNYEDEPPEDRQDRLDEVHFHFKICLKFGYMLSTEVFPWLDESETPADYAIHYHIEHRCRGFLAKWEKPAWHFSTRDFITDIGPDSDAQCYGFVGDGLYGFGEVDSDGSEGDGSDETDDHSMSCECLVCEGALRWPDPAYEGRMVCT